MNSRPEMATNRRAKVRLRPFIVSTALLVLLAAMALVLFIALASFDRLPRDLRICFAHGGGSFTFLLGRLENAWHRRDVVRGQSTAPPSAYLDRFEVDSAVYDGRALRYLVDVMGPSSVLLGSDYPFPLGEEHVGQVIRSCRFPHDVEARLLGVNALEFLGLADG